MHVVGVPATKQQQTYAHHAQDLQQDPEPTTPVIGPRISVCTLSSHNNIFSYLSSFILTQCLRQSARASAPVLLMWLPLKLYMYVC